MVARLTVGLFVSEKNKMHELLCIISKRIALFEFVSSPELTVKACRSKKSLVQCHYMTFSFVDL